MENFVKHYNETLSVVEDYVNSLPDKNGFMFFCYINAAKSAISNISSRNGVIEEFIRQTFDHLEDIANKKDLKHCMEYIDVLGFKDMYSDTPEEVREEIWPLIHDMVNDCIDYIHEKREWDGEKYTKTFLSDYSVKKSRSIMEKAI